MTSKKSGGLGQGTSAFFRSGPRDVEEEEGDRMVEPVALPEPTPVPRPKKKKVNKVRTSVTLYPDTLARMEAMKIESLRDGVRVTYSQLISEAINDLADKRGITLDQ
ncbi:MAG: hypothetical protein KDD73_15000 [Anaerolineales bacterium]|nr:hypothetical protein [Anaerolineales bacterium]